MVNPIGLSMRYPDLVFELVEYFRNVDKKINIIGFCDKHTDTDKAGNRTVQFQPEK